MNNQVKPTVLLVEDDSVTAIRISAGLEVNGFFVIAASTLNEAKQLLSQHSIELLVLDIKLPDGLGLELIDTARARNIGILCISTAGELDDRINALQMGADDYLLKPVANAELALKLKNLHARINHQVSGSRLVSRFDRFVCNFESRKVTDEDGGEIDITPGEFDVLGCFLKHPNVTLGRERLISMLSAEDAAENNDRSIDIMVYKLRQKFERNPKSPSLLKTVYGVGYILDCGVTMLPASNYSI